MLALGDAQTLIEAEKHQSMYALPYVMHIGLKENTSPNQALTEHSTEATLTRNRQIVHLGHRLMGGAL